ncbi:hypothetical protein [Mesorhizobium cantuariense]|uniref:Uncharacterized protein n=1 Tax=Mesorhizobium cantuariense TaxID=1300275 RepID=A0ABV7MKU8_9HYPH
MSGAVENHNLLDRGDFQIDAGECKFRLTCLTGIRVRVRSNEGTKLSNFSVKRRHK